MHSELDSCLLFHKDSQIHKASIDLSASFKT